MSPIPLAQIIFYLATLFMPNSATTFTLSSGYDQKVTWVRQTHGAWQCTTDSGEAGIWSVSHLSVSVVDHGTTNKTDLAPFLKVMDSGDQNHENLAFLDGYPVATSMTNSSITFSQDKGGVLSRPMVINYSAK